MCARLLLLLVLLYHQAYAQDNCSHVIIGAGWSGTYFAWRVAVDAEKYPAAETCIFEASNRIGGRAYSKANIPGMEDLRIDLGAYRFDTHAMPLSNHVIKQVLGFPTKCYDPGACNAYGNLQVIRDAYDNAKGYANGPEGLANLFLEKGGRIFYEHRLIAIEDGTDKSKPIKLRFENGAVVECSTTFLNMPATAIEYLDKNSILFTKASPETLAYLKYPVEENGAKQFLIYRNAMWRTVENLTEGLFHNSSAIPPINGRFHDFYGKCPPSALASDCWGAVLTFYDFVDQNTSYFATWQKNISDPYTYIAFNESEEAATMIKSVHYNFIEALKQKVNYTIPWLDEIPYPEGTVISVWWHRNQKNAIVPGVSQLQKDGKVISDPKHIIRNRVSKPLDNYNIYLANEAYSTGDGWAHPSLILTERILYHYVLGTKNLPSWVNASCYPDCFGTPFENCKDCVSPHWYQMEIVVDKPDLPQTCTDELCPTTISYLGSSLPYACPTYFQTPQLSLNWTWINTTHIQITFQMNGSGWVGLGFGSSMMLADMVVGYLDSTTNQPVIEQRYSTNYTQPKIVETSHLGRASMKTKNKGVTKIITFIRPIVGTNASLSISFNKPTPILIASSPVQPRGTRLNQHTFQMTHEILFYCGRKVQVTFENDILPLFRKKDIEAMAFQYDLTSYEDVKENAATLYSRIEDKTVYGLETGMPPDITWSVTALNLFKEWIDTGMQTAFGNPSTPANPPEHAVTFADIQPLFRQFDRDSMLSCCSMDLWDYNTVKSQASRILEALESKTMPCDAPWPDTQIQLFQQWITDGFIEGTPLPSDRETFYKMFNIESFPEFVPLAKKKLDNLLQQSHNLINDPHAAERFWTPFNYTYDAFQERMNDIYKDLATAADADGNLTLFKTIDKVLIRIRQLAPFNLIDGGWINRCCLTGPIDEVHSLLWGILTDEMGDGDVNKNHCLLYQELLNSVGIYLPAVNTQDFANDPNFLDSAFTTPAYSLLLAYFTHAGYFPELLGTTLQIEWGVLGLWDFTKVLKYWGLNPHFYELHIGIDNAVAGHGYRAKRAVEIYLDNIRELEGEEAVQQHWTRIWNGYLAYDGLGSLGDDLNNLLEKNPTPAEDVKSMMTLKASYGSLNHQDRRIGSATINDLFQNTSKFLDELQNSAWIVYGSPEASPFLTFLTSFDGPMFKVFDEDDLNTWRNWIFSLKNGIPQANRNPEMDSYDGMRHLIERVGRVASAVPGHNIYQVWGPSPNTGEIIRQSVAVWLQISLSENGGNPDTMLQVLKEPTNGFITCGDVNTSTFLTTLLAPSNTMGKMYSRYAADVLGDIRHPSTLWTWDEIIRRWIEDECPMKTNHGFSLFPSPPDEKTLESLPYARLTKKLPAGGAPKSTGKPARRRKYGPGQYWVH